MVGAGFGGFETVLAVEIEGVDGGTDSNTTLIYSPAVLETRLPLNDGIAAHPSGSFGFGLRILATACQTTEDQDGVDPDGSVAFGEAFMVNRTSAGTFS